MTTTPSALSPTSQQVIDNMSMTCEAFIAAFHKGSLKAEFPQYSVRQALQESAYEQLLTLLNRPVKDPESRSMTNVRWVAMSFDKKTERLLEEIELDGLTTETVRRLFKLQRDDDVIGVCFDVLAEHVALLSHHAHGRIDLATADWQIEARPANRTS